MKLTSDAASKRLKMLQDQYDLLLQEESRSATMLRTLEDYRRDKESEDAKDPKDSFNFLEMQQHLRNLQIEIESLKHAINVFNSSAILPKHNITIDQALVRMAFLSKRKRTLREMQVTPDVARPGGYLARESSDVVVCAFHQEDAKDMYRQVCDELYSLQQEINYVNVTAEFMYTPTK